MKKLSELKMIAGHKRYTILSSDMPITISSDGRSCIELPYGQYRFDRPEVLYAGSDGNLEVSYMDTDAEEFASYSYQLYKGRGVLHGSREVLNIKHKNVLIMAEPQKTEYFLKVADNVGAALGFGKYDTVIPNMSVGLIAGDASGYIHKKVGYRVRGVMYTFTNEANYIAGVRDAIVEVPGVMYLYRYNNMAPNAEIVFNNGKKIYFIRNGVGAWDATAWGLEGSIMKTYEAVYGFQYSIEFDQY